MTLFASFIFLGKEFKKALKNKKILIKYGALTS